MTKQKGFTLLELTIVVVLIGILSAFSYPIYQNYLVESRRSDAIVMLTSAANLMERQLSRTGSYEVTGPGVVNQGRAVSDQGFYNLTVETNSSAGAVPTTAVVAGAAGGSTIASINLDCAGTRCYSLAASVAAGSVQLMDSECGIFVLDSQGRKRSFSPAGVENTPDICW